MKTYFFVACSEAPETPASKKDRPSAKRNSCLYLSGKKVSLAKQREQNYKTLGSVLEQVRNIKGN